MNSPSTQPNLDPVCGMSIDPTSAKYSSDHLGIRWYFCAENCRQQFVANPDQYTANTTPSQTSASRKHISWSREVMTVVGIFAALVVIVIAARGLAQSKTVSVQPGSQATGVSADPHQNIDQGQGGVWTAATHERKNASQLEFTVALDTHTVDLSGFDPFEQVRLQADGQAYPPQTAVQTGERSSHHQSYRLDFNPVTDSNVTVLVSGVGGIEARKLPFQL